MKYVSILIFLEALKGMEAVAEHINEMQKIYDEYGAVFDELGKSYRENNSHKTVRDTSLYFRLFIFLYE